MPPPSHARRICRRRGSVETKRLIMEEAALVLRQERRTALDAPWLFSGRMIRGESDILRGAFEIWASKAVMREVLLHGFNMGESAGRVDALGAYLNIQQPRHMLWRLRSVGLPAHTWATRQSAVRREGDAARTSQSPRALTKRNRIGDRRKGFTLIYVGLTGS